MKITKTDIQYGKNKSAKVGEILICPICGKEFGKKHYVQAFCCGKCKDTYHNGKGDRHKKGYYHKYNQEHTERLERGYTKGYIDGKVSNGVKEKQNTTIWYDSLGRPHSRDFFNPTMTDMLDWKLNCEWHDDDWCEESDF